MALHYKIISSRSEDEKFALKLMDEAFPKTESLKPFFMRLLNLRKKNKWHVWYDDDTRIGFTFLAESKSSIFLVFFAVDRKIRGKGYGMQIIKALKNQYSDKNIYGDIEPVDNNTSDELEKRIRRLKFYERHDFKLADYDRICRGHRYNIIFNGKEFNLEEYKKCASSLIWGLYPIKTTKKGTK